MQSAFARPRVPCPMDGQPSSSRSEAQFFRRSTKVFAILCSFILAGFAKLAAEESPKPETIENGIHLKLVKIPAGEFQMGSNETKEQLTAAYPQYDPSRFKFEDESPIHRVRITRPFYLGAYEVTKAQFAAFAKDAGYKTAAETDGQGGWGYNPDKAEFEGRFVKFNWRSPGFPQEDDHPVVNVTYDDALAFCKWLSEREGKKYRLPTEAEWEYACRAGTSTRYAAGDDPNSLLRSANTFAAETGKLFPQWEKFALQEKDSFSFTAPGGKFAPNAFGIYDMHGNVWEWTSDWYADEYYAQSPVDDPQGPKEGKVKVRRGGSWHTWSLYCRSSFRNWNTPQTRYVLVGFRVVREIE